MIEGMSLIKGTIAWLKDGWRLLANSPITPSCESSLSLSESSLFFFLLKRQDVGKLEREMGEQPPSLIMSGL